MMYDGPERPSSGVRLPLGVVMSSSKIAAVLRQIDLFKKSSYLTEDYKERCIAECKREIADLMGQGSLPLDTAPPGPAVQAGASPKGRTS